MQQETEEDYLNRFTSLSVLLDILHNQRLTLTNPIGKWEDKNDTYGIERYIAKQGTCKSVLALCFSMKRETFHHWKVFSGGADGVCIEFDRKRLLEQMKKCDGIRYGKVEYEFIPKPELSYPKGKWPVKTWPFLKRKAFEDEGEFRIIHQSNKALEVKYITIDRACIRKINTSPWLHPELFKSVRKCIRAIPKCGRLKVFRSTLLDNEEWKKRFGE